MHQYQNLNKWQGRPWPSDRRDLCAMHQGSQNECAENKKPRATRALGCGFVVGREGVEPSTLGLRVVRKIYTILRNLQYSFSTAENTEDLANTEQESIKKHANRSITYHVFGKSGKVRKHGCARRCWRNGPPLCELMRINSIKLASNTTFQHCSVEVSCGMA